MTYVILAAIAVVSLLLGFLMAMPTISHDERIDLHAARKIVTHPQVLLLAMGICLYVGSEMSLASWISPMMEGHFKYTVEAALAGSALFWLAVSIGRLGSAIACHRLPGLRVMNVLLAGGIFSFIILALPFGPWRLWAGIALAGLSFSGVWPLIISLGSARFPQFSGTVVAVLVASGTVGMLIFPSSCGFIIERISPQAGIAMMAALFVTLAGIMVVYGRKTREEKISPIPAGHLPQ